MIAAENVPKPAMNLPVEPLTGRCRTERVLSYVLLWRP